MPTGRSSWRGGQGARRRVHSVWMAIERERGISVSWAVMSFEHDGLALNLRDTPGRQDFSEDTYRTLTAVECGDGARRRPKGTMEGIEEQTRKPFEVCRLRNVPIITFVIKLDREGGEPFDSFIAILTILKLPHSHAMFSGHGGSKRTGRGRERAWLERLGQRVDPPDTG
jgi:peptide chain release factor 3